MNSAEGSLLKAARAGLHAQATCAAHALAQLVHSNRAFTQCTESIYFSNSGSEAWPYARARDSLELQLGWCVENAPVERDFWNQVIEWFVVEKSQKNCTMTAHVPLRAVRT